jgi:S-adenosyl-L-methionine hydrolase (adenosine-forming)
MTIFLFTDFGAADLYVGQVKAVLARHAPGVPVIDLLHETPSYNVKVGAHLLAALASQIPSGSVTMAVVDPGVGSARPAAIADIDGRWFVGPDNGLLSVVAGRAEKCSVWRITWQPDRLAPSFHGRDLFARIAAALARGEPPENTALAVKALEVRFDALDLAEIVYIDHYGNALTGLRAGAVSHAVSLVAGGATLPFRRVFSEAAPGTAFWYENSLGLVEIAANAASAASKLDLRVGDPVSFTA